jgi:hypothetical protein
VSAGDIDTVINDPLARALKSITHGTGQIDLEAFARLVISKLDNSLLLGTDAKENLTVQWWYESRKVWVRAGGGRRLAMKVIDICREHARPLEKDGTRGQAPSFYGNKSFFTPITDIVKSYLSTSAKAAQLDGEHTRCLLRISCGTVLDMRSGTTRPCRPDDRLSKSAGYPYRAWDAPQDLQNDVKAAIAAITAEWEKGETVEKTIFITAKLDAILGKSKLLSLVFDLVGS